MKLSYLLAAMLPTFSLADTWEDIFVTGTTWTDTWCDLGNIYGWGCTETATQVWTTMIPST